MKWIAISIVSMMTLATAAADVQVEKSTAPQSVVARGVAAKGSDFDVIPVVLGLSGEKLEKYQKALAKRDAGYKKWEESTEGQSYLAAQKNAAGAAARPGQRAGRRPAAGAQQAQPTDAQKKYQELRAKQEAVRKDLRREFNKQFDTDQIRLIAGHMLYESVSSRLRNSRLDESQKHQAYALCSALTANLDESAATKDPYLEPDAKTVDAALAQVTRVILRPDQPKPTSAQ